MPCSVRAAISTGMVGAAAHATDASANAASPHRQTRREPNRSPIEPAVSIPAASATV
jgi:hypothetical protein